MTTSSIVKFQYPSKLELIVPVLKSHNISSAMSFFSIRSGLILTIIRSLKSSDMNCNLIYNYHSKNNTKDKLQHWFWMSWESWEYPVFYFVVTTSVCIIIASSYWCYRPRVIISAVTLLAIKQLWNWTPTQFLIKRIREFVRIRIEHSKLTRSLKFM